MFILDTNKIIKKTIIVYILVSIIAIIFTKIYYSFSHGINSNYMSFMFLYPLIGGALTFIVIYPKIKINKVKYKTIRISFNLYNTGIAILTTEGLLRGIFQIAGTSSDYMIYYSIFGWSITIISLISISIQIFLNKKAHL